MDAPNYLHLWHWFRRWAMQATGYAEYTDREWAEQRYLLHHLVGHLAGLKVSKSGSLNWLCLYFSESY